MIAFQLEAQTVDTIQLKSEVDSLIQLSRSQLSKRKIAEAELNIQSAVQKVEAGLGKNSETYAMVLFNLGRLYHNSGRPKEAQPLYEQAQRLFIEHGKKHPDYPKCLGNLGLVHLDNLEYDAAELLFLEANELFAKSVGKKHPFYIGGLNNLANVYKEKGEYEKAIGIYQENLAITASNQGKLHPDYAMSLINLGNVYKLTGVYAKAEKLFLESLDISENVYGRVHPDCAGALSNLGNLYRTLGENAKAEQYLTESCSIFEQTVGASHPVYAQSINNLAKNYTAIGKFTKAQELFLKARDILTKALGAENPAVTGVNVELAILYSEAGEHAEAEKLFRGAVDMYAKTIGKDHTNYATAVNNLGLEYVNTGRFEEAEPLLREAGGIWLKKFGDNHPNYILSLTAIASLYYSKNEYEKALPVLLELKEKWNNITGNEHSNYAWILNTLAAVYRTKRDFANASSEYLEFNQAYLSMHRKASAFFSEREMLLTVGKFKKVNASFFSLLLDYPKDTLVKTVFDNTLSQSNVLLDAAIAREKGIELSDSTTQAYNANWKNCFFQLAKWYEKPVKDRDMNLVKALENKAEEFEKELIRRMPGFAASRKEIHWRDLVGALKPNTAALEFIHFNYYNPNPTDSILYAALLLLPNDTTPHFIPLLEERQLQSLLNRPGLSDEIIVKDLYGNQPELAQLLWAPLEPWLRDVKTVYYAPSGLLHRINPAAILDPSGECVSATRAWVRLGSTRELVTQKLADQSFAQNGGKTPLAAVYGGIQYEMDSTAFATANPLDLATANTTFRKDGNFKYVAEANDPATDQGRGESPGGWDALPATAKEADEVGALLRKAGYRTEVKKGLAASEEHLKKLGANGQSSPRILHLATHGFAYPDPKKATTKGFGDTEPTYKLQDDPMLRSGLLLAGSNFYWKNKRPLDGREDGVLVAYEVRDLNLRQTELAVLSACQTGLGDVVGSEGVYGLQRAFRIAGAKFLIVSLWQVPDDKTQQLMGLFYQYYLVKKEPLRTAFRHAQEEMQRTDPNPYNWAGFVLVE